MKETAFTLCLNKSCRCCFAAFLILSSLVVVGCGPSQQDLMMRSAMRSRGGGDDEAPAPKPATTKPKKEAAEKSPKPDPPKSPPDVEDGKKLADTNESGDEPKEDSTDETSEVEEALIAIEERKPEVALTLDERRAKAADNLNKVATALLAYAKDHNGRLPETFIEVNGFQTLSWRVEILPYLGYEDLYKKFDSSVPYNRPPNKDLIKYIPDEYVSPERFDVRTNIVMPSRTGFIGGDNGRQLLSDIEDGAANTILIVEVNDSQAQTWTKPADFNPGSIDSAWKSMTGLREDGSFAVWANGWPVMLANELSPQVFWNALTTEAGDGQLAGKVHRDIPVKKATKAAVAAIEAPEPANNAPQPIDDRYTQAPEEVAVQREPVPSRSDISLAQDKLRKLYAEKMGDAKEDDKKSTLATEMLDASVVMEQDPAGAYVLQTAAMRLSIDSGSVDTLHKAIDQRIGRFEVDAYEENKRWLLDFGKGVIQRDPKSIDKMVYLKRAIKVIHAGIHDDDYVSAGVIVRHAYRYFGERRDDSIPKSLNRLKSLLAAANRDYAAAADALQEYRLNPDNGDAAAEFGRFLCFIKGDWATGLPLLELGGSEALRNVATLDLAGASDFSNQVAIGDAWWELSEKARTGVYRQSCRDRAIAWYNQAYPVMPDSLDRLHVKSRLDEADGEEPSSPLALIYKLAEDVNVDLAISLSAVANVGQAQRDAGAATNGVWRDSDG